MNAGTLTLERSISARRGPTTALAVLAVLALAILGFLLLRGGSSAELGSPRSVDSAELRDLSRSLDQPVYWAGPTGTAGALELTETANGSVYVRYLHDGAVPGDARDRFTTVATYSVPDAFAALSREADRPTAVTRTLPNGGLALLDVRRPNSVHLAWPDSGYEVEHFDPSPKRALDLVLEGAVAPVR
jgi:hypothetical protein